MSDRRWRVARRLAPVFLLVALAVALRLPDLGPPQMTSSTRAGVERVTAALDGLPEDPLVLIGFDPDIGTFAEVRPTVRALLADLLARDGRIGVVSLTAEGRALASAELARLGRGEANPARLLDLGFVSGAEAGLVDLSGGLTIDDPEGAFAREVAADDIEAFDAVIVVGGNDLGPRSWIEQVAPRIGDVPFLAVTPTILLPEVQPYLAGGQLAAVIGTPWDGATYRASLELGNLERFAEPTEPRRLPLLIGMLIAIVVLGQALGARLLDVVRQARARALG